MDWKFVVILVPAIVQAVVALLQWLGITPTSMRIPTSTTALMTLLMLLTWVAVALDYRSRRSRPPNSLQPTKFEEYLSGLAESDSRNMWQQVHFNFGRDAQAVAYLNAVEPYVHLVVSFVNASVFELNIDHIEGKVHYDGHPLHDAPEVIRNPGTSSVVHGQQGGVNLRQNLLPETARKMREELPVTLSTGQMAIFLRYRDDTGADKSVRIAYPDSVFVIDKIY